MTNEELRRLPFGTLLVWDSRNKADNGEETGSYIPCVKVQNHAHQENGALVKFSSSSLQYIAGSEFLRYPNDTDIRVFNWHDINK